MQVSIQRLTKTCVARARSCEMWTEGLRLWDVGFGCNRSTSSRRFAMEPCCCRRSWSSQEGQLTDRARLFLHRRRFPMANYWKNLHIASYLHLDLTVIWSFCNNCGTGVSYVLTIVRKGYLQITRALPKIAISNDIKEYKCQTGTVGLIKFYSLYIRDGIVSHPV